jgi:hypothetical protein
VTVWAAVVTVTSGINKMVALSATILARPKAPMCCLPKARVSCDLNREPWGAYLEPFWFIHFGFFTSFAPSL